MRRCSRIIFQEIRKLTPIKAWRPIFGSLNHTDQPCRNVWHNNCAIQNGGRIEVRYISTYAMPVNDNEVVSNEEMM
ncbi:hypothetical protein NPIL_337431 [Nephila pilipes]|uniref:Uncharacterized protein n=1 Tax=Nephila pilipes TaxID=299642 RepID=A0A8X6PZ41_NEPPI|nr:hypothetical protein NPIL_337431 [Nephila pilipes]